MMQKGDINVIFTEMKRIVLLQSWSLCLPLFRAPPLHHVDLFLDSCRVDVDVDVDVDVVCVRMALQD